MSKELVALLKRTLRMPWEAHLRPGRWDEVVLNRIPNEGGFTKDFLKTPKNENVRVKSIALPTLMFLVHKPEVNTEDLTMWEDLTMDEKRLIVRHYGLRDSYRMIVYPVHNPVHISELASYIAGCFGFTLNCTAMFCQFGELVDAAFDWERGQQSMYTALRNIPLLVVSGMLGRHPNMQKVEGAIVELLTWRANLGYPTVTIEIPTSAQLLSALMQGSALSPEMYLDMVHGADAGMTRLGALLVSPMTYVYTGDEARQFNDSRLGHS